MRVDKKIEALSKLEQLKENGSLTEEEYAKMRTKLMTTNRTLPKKKN